ncbi:MAG: prepilin-type N-terminal cleavage/methylation domain-containing protein [Steroidobacteraceae bacterium]
MSDHALPRSSAPAPPLFGRGMTLIEALVALALIALLSVGLLSAFRLGSRTYRQVARADSGSWHVVVASRFLRHILSSAYPFEPAAGSAARGINGSSDRLELTGPMPAAGGSMGHYRYVVALRTRADGLYDLIVRSSLDRNGTTPPVGNATSAASGEVLLQGIKGIKWAYLAPAASDGSSDTTPSQWLDSWNHVKPPLLVRLRVAFPAGDGRLWPELIVHPRITDDAQCQFDVVSQSCREASQ